MMSQGQGVPRRPVRPQTLGTRKRPDPAPGFHFRRRRDRINWRLLGSVDVARVQREVDLHAIEDVMDNVTFCDIESEDLKYTDPNFVKLFQLSQMIVEYLLYCQNVLQQNEQDLLRQIDENSAELKTLQGQTNEHLAEIYTLKKENKILKKTVFAYQVMFKVPPFQGANVSAPGMLGQMAVHYHKCRYCPKVFTSRPYLESHLGRRHPDQPSYFDDDDSHIRELVAGNDSGANVVRSAAPDTAAAAKPEAALLEQMTKAMVEFTAKLAATEQQLRDDMQRKLDAELAARQRAAEDQQRAEREAQTRELEELRAKMHSELERERDVLDLERDRLEEMAERVAEDAHKQQQSQLRPAANERDRSRSNLGNLEDVTDDEGRSPAKPVAAPPPQEEPKSRDAPADLSAVIEKLESRQYETLLTMQKMVSEEMSSFRQILQHETSTQVNSQLQNTADRLDALQQALLKQRVPSKDSLLQQRTSSKEQLQQRSSSKELLQQRTSSKELLAQLPPEPVPKVKTASRESLTQQPAPSTPKKSKERAPPPEPETLLQEPEDLSYESDYARGPKSPRSSDGNRRGARSDWPEISRHMRQLKFGPLPYAPWIKANYMHSGVTVVKEREAIEAGLQQEMEDRELVPGKLTSGEFLDAKVAEIEHTKDERAATDPAYAQCYDHIWDELDRITAQHFRLKPKASRAPPRNSRFSHLVGGAAGSRFGAGGGGGGSRPTARWRTSVASIHDTASGTTSTGGKKKLRSVLSSMGGGGRASSTKDYEASTKSSRWSTSGISSRWRGGDATTSDDSDSDDGSRASSPTTPRTPLGSVARPSWRSKAAAPGSTGWSGLKRNESKKSTRSSHSARSTHTTHSASRGGGGREDSGDISPKPAPKSPTKWQASASRPSPLKSSFVARRSSGDEDSEASPPSAAPMTPTTAAFKSKTYNPQPVASPVHSKKAAMSWRGPESPAADGPSANGATAKQQQQQDQPRGQGGRVAFADSPRGARNEPESESDWDRSEVSENRVIGDKGVHHVDVSTDGDDEHSPVVVAAPEPAARKPAFTVVQPKKVVMQAAPAPVVVRTQRADPEVSGIGDLLRDLASESEVSPDKAKVRPPPINTRVVQEAQPVPAHNYSEWDMESV